MRKLPGSRGWAPSKSSFTKKNWTDWSKKSAFLPWKEALYRNTKMDWNKLRDNCWKRRRIRQIWTYCRGDYRKVRRKRTYITSSFWKRAFQITKKWAILLRKLALWALKTLNPWFWKKGLDTKVKNIERQNLNFMRKFRKRMRNKKWPR